MNTVKEKKLNAIKSDISEIKDFVMSNSSINDKQLSNDDNLNDSVDDTITLTKIVDSKNSVWLGREWRGTWPRSQPAARLFMPRG